MPMRSLIPPDELICLRMPGYSWTNLASSEVILILPFKLYRGLAAVIFYFLFLCSSKNCLPAQPEPISEVSDIHHILLHKLLSNFRINVLENFSAVRNWRFSPLIGRSGTVKPDFHWPG